MILRSGMLAFAAVASSCASAPSYSESDQKNLQAVCSAGLRPLVDDPSGVADGCDGLTTLLLKQAEDAGCYDFDLLSDVMFDLTQNGNWELVDARLAAC